MSKFNVGDWVVWNPFGTEHHGVIVAVGPLGDTGFDYAVKIPGDAMNASISEQTGFGGEFAWEKELANV